MTDQEQLKERLRELMPSGAGSVGGALVGLAVGGPVGAVAGAVATPALEQLAREALAVRRRRGERAYELAATEAGLSPEELLLRILGDERLLDLAVAVVTSASETAVEAKIRGLSRALAAGATTPDDAVVDEQLLLVDALADLQAPHIQVLAQLVKAHPQGRTMRPPRAVQLQRPGWTVDEIVDALPGTRTVIERILCVLEAHGLAREVRSAIKDPDTGCSITAAGVACMNLLNERGDENRQQHGAAG